MTEYVVIGDGAAGTTAAQYARKRDPDGKITIYSDDPNAAYYRAALTNYLIGELREDQLFAVPPDFYARNRVERVLARVASIDTAARRITLASGGAPVFAFARQWWLEVRAETQSGEPVCLVPVDPVTHEADPNGIPTPNCSSGSPTGGGDWNSGNAPAQDLLTCDPREVANEFGARLAASGQGVNNADVVLSVAQPLDDCDPWLTNFQKILTDGDPDRTGRFLEVPYQSLLPDIVKLQTRVATQQVMVPLKSFDNPDTENDDREVTFEYVFDTSGADVRNQKVKITFALHLRHLPPYFIRELGQDPGYPDGLTADALLSQMVVSTAATDSVTSKRVLAR